MVLTKLKIAVFAPMPSASVSTATAVKPGFFSNCRKANLRSFIGRVSGQSSVVSCLLFRPPFADFAIGIVRNSDFGFLCHLDFDIRHSYLSDSMGSTLAARRAGSQLARIATPASNSDTPANVTGSIGL